jgi:predicted neuraminidase
MRYLLGLMVGGCSVLAAEPAIVKSEFIYETPPHPECHASTLAEGKAGLVCAWFGGKKEKSPDVGIWMSRYVEGEWSVPMEVANGVQADGKRFPCWNPVLFQPKQGPLMLFYKVGPNPEKWWGMLRTSEDGGASWSDGQRLPEGILGPIKNKPVQLADGTILSPTSTEHNGWRVHFERSKDGGKTWTATKPVNDGKKIGAIQPSILFLGGEKLLAIGRTRAQGNVFEVESADHGQTWGEMKLGHLPNPNSGTDAVTLQDGRHLIVYNHSNPIIGKFSGLRSPLNVAVSADGRAWKAALVLEDEKLREFSYPAVIQTKDGKVHITYTWKRQRVKHVVVDPAKLTPREFEDGKWPAGATPAAE